MTIFLGSMLFASCWEKDDAVDVSPDQLWGLWRKDNSREYWRYNDDNTGVTWDLDDDVSEEESNLRYEWSVEQGVITHVFRGNQGNQQVPKTFTIIAMSDSQMKWRDVYGFTTTLNRIVE